MVSFLTEQNFSRANVIPLHNLYDYVMHCHLVVIYCCVPYSEAKMVIPLKY